jgi:peptidoglycan/LPS O-acetylase OafA/YrhL
MTDRPLHHANPAPERDTRHWAIEAWRGVAAFMVLVAHWWTPLGWSGPFSGFAFTGVDVFFVLSGFVFAPQICGHSPIRLGDYALRRVARIYPAYLLALGLYVGLRWWEGKPLQYLPEHLLMAHLQSREMAFYYSPPFWSLPSEVAFYGAVPLLAALSVSRFARAGWWGLVMGAVGLRVWLIANADVMSQNMAYVVLYHLPGLLVEFLLGVWAYRQLRGEAPAMANGSPRRQAWPWLLLGTLVGLASLAAFHALEAGRGHSLLHGQAGLGVAVAAALMLVGSAWWNPSAAWLRDLGTWAGRLSYSVYLLHPLWGVGLAEWRAKWGAWPALMVAITGLLLTSWAVHRWIEEPARVWARRRGALQNTSVSPG